jgi:hypothetical protein
MGIILSTGFGLAVDSNFTENILRNLAPLPTLGKHAKYAGMKKISKQVQSNVLILARAYMKAAKIDEAAFSLKFYGNTSFLMKFKASEQSITLTKLDDLVSAIVAEWPDGVERPYLPAVFMDRDIRG